MPTEVEFDIQGRKLAGKRWGREGNTPIMALHGWLDNANSFDLIAPALSDFDVFALDFAGHGNSDHRPAHTPYLGTLDAQDIIAAANQLQWEHFSLLAHSMGAEVSAHMIGMADKALDDIDSKTETKHRHIVRREFWTRLLQAMNTKSSLYQNCNPGKYHWIGAGSGVRGLAMNFGATKKYGRSELYIDRGDQAENELVFEQLLALKDQIEKDFGGPLRWDRLSDKRASRITADIDGNVFDKDRWEDMIKKMTDNMVRLDKSLRPHIKEIGEELRQRQTK